MNQQFLNGDWLFRQVGSKDWAAGHVPGGVHTDLLALGRIPDPFVADNELKVQWVAECDWEYQRTFSVDPLILGEEQVFLICDGLDTLADVYLNDQYLGHADNMFRGWEWAVKPFLRAEGNLLRVVFGSPIRFIQSRQAQLPLLGGGDIPGGPHLRKAPCQWGWDWGPKLPPIGLWKDVRLAGFSEARFRDVHVHHQVLGQTAHVYVDVEAQAWRDEEFQVLAKIIAPGGEAFEVDGPLMWKEAEGVQSGALKVNIQDPERWWPNGYGKQPLYAVEVYLRNGERVLDQRNYSLGLRKLELRQDPDEWGKSFTFYVNDLPIFAKGSDWIPADSFPTRLTKATLEGLIHSASAAHMNMLRVWGGGYYPEDTFFDLCDRYGLLVWQDFMFACGVYPADEAFFENVHKEAVENVRRIRHHACLAIWCGNNEMEEGWCAWGWNNSGDAVTQRLKDGYDRMFHHMLPDLLAEEDPDHPYWPSSASSGKPFDTPNGQDQGDCHYWEVWHGRKPFTAYRSQFPRFMSEFGFQALPTLRTVGTYAEPSEWNMTSYVMEHHQKSGSGNGLMISQLTDAFRMPKDFPALVYLSMVLQAEGIRYGVEHWRRNRLRVSGTLIWQLNDCWPVASWSSLDYFGRWKALHYHARHFYAPLLLSVENSGKVMKIHLTSDLPRLWEGCVRWRLETLEGNELERGEQRIRAAALQDTWVDEVDFSTRVQPENQRELVFVAELWGPEIQADEKTDWVMTSRCVVPFVANKHLALKNPGLSVLAEINGEILTLDVSTQTLARFLELDLEGADVVFSDNYFDLPAAQTAHITCALPSGWTLAQAQAAVRVRSLYESYS